jgi:hypothetical protein
VSGEDGDVPWSWIAGLGLLGIAGLAAFLVYRAQNEEPPGGDNGAPGEVPPQAGPDDIQEVPPAGTPPAGPSTPER